MTYSLYNSETDEEIKNQPVTLEQALEEFYYLPEDSASFFILKNKGGQILQLAWQNENEWLVDMPINPRFTYQQYNSFDTSKAIITAFFIDQDVPTMFHLQRVEL